MRVGRLVEAVLGPGAFRMVLALSVVVSHLSALDIGVPAVVLFFVLSGYWVMRMYAEKYRPLYGDAVFYVSRLLRIWLLYVVVFSFVLVMRAQSEADFDLDYLWGLLLLGVATNRLDVLGVSWSLDIEIQFYLLVPLFFALAQVLLRMRPPMAGVLAVSAVAVLTVAGWVLWDRFGLRSLLVYLPAFAAGMAIYLTGYRPSGRTALFSAALFLALGAAAMLSPATEWLIFKRFEANFEKHAFAFAWAAALIPFVAWNVAQRSDRLDRHLGNLSYPLYITHWPLVVGLGGFLGFGGPADKAILLVASVALALVVYVVIDMRIEAFRLRVVREAARGRSRPT